MDCIELYGGVHTAQRQRQTNANFHWVLYTFYRARSGYRAVGQNPYHNVKVSVLDKMIVTLSFEIDTTLGEVKG